MTDRRGAAVTTESLMSGVGRAPRVDAIRPDYGGDCLAGLGWLTIDSSRDSLPALGSLTGRPLTTVPLLLGWGQGRS